MTIPALITKLEEKILITQLKNTYSLISNSYQLTIQQDGLPADWGMEQYPSWSVEANTILIKQFTKHLKVKEYCINKPGCFPNKNYKSIANKETTRNEYNNMRSARLENGASIAIMSNSPKCEINNWGRDIQNMCGQLVIDVNGNQGPNVMGKDYFVFYILATGIVPVDFKKDMWFNGCSGSSGSGYGGNNYDGWGCTAWALYNGNFEYTRCSPEYLKTHDECP